MEIRQLAIVALLAGGALAVRSVAPASAFAADDPSVQSVTRLLAAIDANDLDGSANLFVDGAVVIQPRVGGLPEIYVGRAQIRWWLLNLFAQHAYVEMDGAPRVSANHVRWAQGFTVDAFRQLGLDLVAVDSEAVLAPDQRIESLRFTLSPDAARSIQAAPRTSTVAPTPFDDPGVASAPPAQALLLAVAFVTGAVTILTTILLRTAPRD